MPRAALARAEQVVEALQECYAGDTFIPNEQQLQEVDDLEYLSSLASGTLSPFSIIFY